MHKSAVCFVDDLVSTLTLSIEPTPPTLPSFVDNVTVADISPDIEKVFYIIYYCRVQIFHFSSISDPCYKLRHRKCR